MLHVLYSGPVTNHGSAFSWLDSNGKISSSFPVKVTNGKISLPASINLTAKWQSMETSTC